MKRTRQRLCVRGITPRAALAFRLAMAFFLWAGTAAAEEPGDGGGSPLSAWTGIWTIVDHTKDSPAADGSPESTVEIRPTADGTGLEIIRRVQDQRDIKETLILDESRRPVETHECSGWQSAGLLAEAGVIIVSSEMNCKETGSIATTNFRIILGPELMADILALNSGGQTRLATRKLALERDLPQEEGLAPGWVTVAARTEAAAPWELDTIIRLSELVDDRVLQAALMEKEAELNLTTDSLKQMKKAKLSTPVIDLLVALAYPDQFHVEKNGQVELRPWIVSTSRSPEYRRYPADPGILYPNTFYNCYSGYGYYSGLPYVGPCLSYYSPFWWDYPVVVPVVPRKTVNANPAPPSKEGYVQVQPKGRYARSREGLINSRGGRASGAPFDSSAPAAVIGPSVGGGGASSGGGSSAPASPSASPGGYSSGSGGGRAVPR